VARDSRHVNMSKAQEEHTRPKQKGFLGILRHPTTRQLFGIDIRSLAAMRIGSLYTASFLYH